MQQYRSHFLAQRRGILVGDRGGLGEARVAITRVMRWKGSFSEVGDGAV